MHTKHYPQYTYADYERWEGRWELIEGIPFSMFPWGDITHQRASGCLLGDIMDSLKKQEQKDSFCEIIHSLDWIIDDHNVVCPDLSMITDISGDYITSPPAMIIEILSESTIHKDKVIKFEIYEERGVKHYIIVDPVTKEYQIFELINGKYKENNKLTTFFVNDNYTIDLNIDIALADI